MYNVNAQNNTLSRSNLDKNLLLYYSEFFHFLRNLSYLFCITLENVLKLSSYLF